MEVLERWFVLGRELPKAKHRRRSEKNRGDCPNFRGHRGEAVVNENGTVPFAGIS